MSHFPAQFDDAGMTEFDRLEREVRGRDVDLHLCLPGGREECFKVTLGQDVAYAKTLLAKRLDVSYNTIQFFLGKKLMFDPLSFADFIEIVEAPHDQAVRIDVTL